VTLRNIEQNVPLAPLTTLKVGGNARFYYRARTENDLAAAIHHSADAGIDLFILGGGSNVLISDEGFNGMVVHIELKGITTDGSTTTAAAGEDWDAFVEYCVSQDLAGIECMSGIPGTVGGTPVQNVGAYGQEVSETIFEVRCFDRQMQEFVTLSNVGCSFTYRTSIFNSIERDRYIVLAVTYRLTPGGRPKLDYKDIKHYFTGRVPTLAETRKAIITIRKQKSMVIDAADPNSRSAGSFFKNPVVELSVLDNLRSAIEDVPSFPFGDKVKIPAAWLIERAGFHKGFQHGRAGISTNHSLALINRGGATAADIVELKGIIQSAVEEKFGIRLVPEPVFVGFSQKG
jgi:UDP-N-acetylmuramate dehydrogenase